MGRGKGEIIKRDRKRLLVGITLPAFELLLSKVPQDVSILVSATSGEIEYK